MAENENTPPVDAGEEDDIDTPGYKPPAQKTLEEIQKADADDESLVRYKQQLLGDLPAGDTADGKNVVVEKMSFLSNGRDDIELDLRGDLSKLKEKPIIIKEGCEYRIKITFRVKREIVAGLRLHQVTYRKGIRVDKSNSMVGSFGPKAESQEFTLPVDEAPSGMMSRGSYVMKSKFTDDDKFVHLAWDWAFEIKKEWD
ncbi:rho GDP-dissociation inhibitor 1-like isoform X2 [Apostichopus japonicus]